MQALYRTELRPRCGRLTLAAGRSRTAPSIRSGAMAEGYDVQAIEASWQRRWRDERTYEIDNDDPRPPFYVLCMYPYPSGPAHMGHVRNYTFGDLIVRYRTMHGHGVLSPIGFDSFGLPAENAAIKSGEHPRTFTEARIAELTSSLERIGAIYDWRRLVKSHDPQYIRWTQWIFLQAARSRPRLPEDGAGQLVPGLPDGARQRAGPGRRDVRAVGRRRREARPRAVVLQDHRVRRPTARRPRRAGLARARRHDATQLDRPLGGRRVRHGRVRRRGHAATRRGHAGVHDPSRHELRNDLRRRSRPSTRWSSRSPRRTARARWTTFVAKVRTESELDRAVGRRAAREARRLHRRVRPEPVQQPAGAALPRRLRPHGLRHGGHHGRTRPGPARLGLRRRLRPADHPHGAAARRVGRRGVRRRRCGDQQRLARRLEQGRRHRQGHRLARGEGHRRAHRQLPAARLAAVPAALLGLPDPDRLLPGPRGRSGGRRPAAGAGARRRGVPPHRRIAVALPRGFPAHHVSRVRRPRAP